MPIIKVQSLDNLQKIVEQLKKEGKKIVHCHGCFDIVDYVALNQWETAVEIIKILKPDVYVKGKEVVENGNVDMVQGENGKISNIKAEEEAVLSVGGRLHFTEE